MAVLDARGWLEHGGALHQRRMVDRGRRAALERRRRRGGRGRAAERGASHRRDPRRGAGIQGGSRGVRGRGLGRGRAAGGCCRGGAACAERTHAFVSHAPRAPHDGAGTAAPHRRSRARLARASVAVSRHGDLADLEALVADAPGPVIVVADTVFSMDGDALDVRGTADVCRRHQALLVLDEAHAVLGPDPSLDDLAGIEVVRVGTLSKTLGSLGGFAACSQAVRDLLVNAARPSIFTTGLSPADAAAGAGSLPVAGCRGAARRCGAPPATRARSWR